MSGIIFLLMILKKIMEDEWFSITLVTLDVSMFNEEETNVRQ